MRAPHGVNRSARESLKCPLSGLGIIAKRVVKTKAGREKTKPSVIRKDFPKETS